MGAQAPTALDPNAPDTRYGGNQRNMIENPAWMAWNQRAWDARKQFGEGSPEHQAALQNEPERYAQTQLGADVAAMRDNGAAAANQLGSDADRIRRNGDAANSQGQQVSAGLAEQGQDAQQRGGPTLNVQGNARQDQVAAGNAAGNFAPNTSGAQGIRQTGAQAAGNIQSAGQLGAQGIAQAGSRGTAGITQAGAQGSADVGQYRAATSGVAALNKFASGPTGPSAAEAMLRLQAARDKASALSRARSARGGPGAVNEALKVAQAEGAAQSADTRGQLSLVQANEAAARRNESLQALTASGQLQQAASQTNLAAIQGGAELGLQSQVAAGNLGVNAQSNAAQTAVGAQTAAGNLGVQATTAATGAELQGSAQKLQSIQVRADIANAVRGMDIDTAKSQLSADLQTMGMNDEQTRFFAGLSEQARQDGMKARQDASVAGANTDAAAAQVQLQYATQAWSMLTAEQQAEIQRLGIERGVIAQNNADARAKDQQTMQFLGTLMMAGATVASDRRAKHDVRRLRSMAASLRRTPGSSYRYKDEKHGAGEHTGPMAQDLERTREFKGAVVERKGIKTVDTGRLVMTHHAALSDLQRQIDRLEKLGRKSKSPDKAGS